MNKYKIILVLLISLLLFGCSDNREVVICNLPDRELEITIKNGQIIKYKDEITGEISSDEIKRLNDHYFKNIDSNEDAINELKLILAENNGTCK